ncbi:ABC transporter ATP-binding protein [Solirubrobacter ginsenosidimutans]|uniref:ABC transporter ATP-binding protein n=1 Tax=Solirubrobacter ginsenosidimutans TaxID=490573 RepID=A0A9X3MTX9_9ACTN|nr:ABC transporter ATP-binding protein [Solirubrobacter ginsenosidimutans]MDA0161223.1 ABC transporter ATP-binding protein [Solirubrobacter ginsenosidimutans]
MLENSPFVARLGDATKTYGRGPGAVHALQGVSVDFTAHTFTAIMGPSGSGKSTLLQVAAGLEPPSSGVVELAGRDLSGLSETALTELRREHVGFVFQSFNLMPTLTVAQNVELPLRLAGRRAGRGRVQEIVERVGLGGRIRHRPFELSGGERQRVAIARALICKPAVTFADEPTGALDTHVAAEVLALLRESVREGGQTVVMVTHDPVAAASAQRVLFLADGRLVDELVAPTAELVAETLTDLAERVRACPV